MICQINVSRTVIIGTHQFSTSNTSNSDLQYKDRVAVVTGAGGGDTVEFVYIMFKRYLISYLL